MCALFENEFPNKRWCNPNEFYENSVKILNFKHINTSFKREINVINRIYFCSTLVDFYEFEFEKFVKLSILKIKLKSMLLHILDIFYLNDKCGTLKIAYAYALRIMLE